MVSLFGPLLWIVSLPVPSVTVFVCRPDFLRAELALPVVSVIVIVTVTVQGTTSQVIVIVTLVPLAEPALPISAGAVTLSTSEPQALALGRLCASPL